MTQNEPATSTPLTAVEAIAGWAGAGAARRCPFFVRVVLILQQALHALGWTCLSSAHVCRHKVPAVRLFWALTELLDLITDSQLATLQPNEACLGAKARYGKC